MFRRAWIRSLFAIGATLLAAATADAGERRRSSDNDGSTRRLDLKTTDRDQMDVDEICLRRRLFKRRHAPEVYYAPPETYGPYIDPQHAPPTGSAKPADAPRAEPPTLPAPGVPMTFPYDGGPAKPMPRTRPAAPEGPTLGPTPGERKVSTPLIRRLAYSAYGEDRRDQPAVVRVRDR
jgi:hypothetical protein